MKMKSNCVLNVLFILSSEQTGPTGTNVADICIVLVHERETDPE